MNLERASPMLIISDFSQRRSINAVFRSAIFRKH